ncbi:MAG: translation initiation factor 2, partial [Thermus sp.]
MKKALTLGVALLGLALAQSVQVEVKGSLDRVLDHLVAA